ncbi:MAG: response regulator [Chromatiaceae bacterium]|jgi:CheY-like chemotaxis protein|nr:response regulator [Chromatiaceae bacterium]
MNPMRILLVDDSKSARYALRLQLQKFGVAVDTAESAEAALERIREDPPDAVFMDHTMPGMNGFEALEILKTTPATAQIPVVMCTSNEDPEFVAQAQRKGALDIVAKSTAGDKLGNLLKRLEGGAALAPAGAPAAAGPNAEEIGAIARREAERLVEERLRLLIESRLAELRESLVAEAAARIEGGLAARVEGITKRLNAEAALEASQYVDARLDAQAAQLAAEAARRVEEGLAGRLESQVEQLRGRFIQAQSEQAQVTAQRLASELIPQAVRQQIGEERAQIAQTVQQSVDAAVTRIAADPGFVNRLTASVEAAAVAKAAETATKVATQRTTELAGGLLQSARSGGATMYLLAAGAALVGVLSAAVVYLLG